MEQHLLALKGGVEAAALPIEIDHRFDPTQAVHLASFLLVLTVQSNALARRRLVTGGGSSSRLHLLAQGRSSVSEEERNSSRGSSGLVSPSPSRGSATASNESPREGEKPAT